jgi:hypothetical protein
VNAPTIRRLIDHAAAGEGAQSLVARYQRGFGVSRGPWQLCRDELLRRDTVNRQHVARSGSAFSAALDAELAAPDQSPSVPTTPPPAELPQQRLAIAKPPLVKDLNAQIANFEREHPDWGQARLHREWNADGTRPHVARHRFRKQPGGRPPRD